MLFSLLLGIILGAISVIFALQNVTVVTVTFLAWQITAPLALVLLGTILSAITVTLLILLPSLIKEEMYVKSLKREKREVEDEYSKYRTSHSATEPSPSAGATA